MKRGLRYWWPLLVVVAVLMAALGLVKIAWEGQAEAHRVGAAATRGPGDDEVSALLRAVQSSGLALQDRNRAVWALGQIGDRRALPVLTSFYTGGECDHAHRLCQKELRKAIDRVPSSPTAIVEAKVAP